MEYEMAKLSLNVTNLEKAALEVQKKFNSDLKRDVTWSLVKVNINDIILNAHNNRFAPDEALTEEEHEKAIYEEDVVAFQNLQKSLECNPQFEQLIGYLDPDSGKVHLIAGHRRTFAAKRAGIVELLVWVTDKLTPEEIEYIRDWPEIHKTKVAHATFAQYKSIFNDLKGRNEEQREKRIQVLLKKGYSRRDILKAERVFGRMDAFCKEHGEKTNQRLNQVKAFETYDQVCVTKFQQLQDQGEFHRITVLDQVAKAFLKNQIAHDDLKATVDGIAELSATDPVYKTIKENPKCLEDENYLRRLTVLARDQKNSRNVVEDLNDYTSRLFSKLVDRADITEMSSCLSELKDAVTRLESAINNINTRGA